MAISDYYVDPSIAGNSGTGTSGDPYGDLQYALDSVTQDTTDGDRFNIKAGTDEILAAALSLTTSYGTPSSSYPLVFQGYTSSQGDGGIGVIDGNGYEVITNAGSGIYWYDMEFHNGPTSGTSQFLTTAQWGGAFNCYVHDTGGTALRVWSQSTAAECRVEDCGLYGIEMYSSQVKCAGCYVKQGASRTMTYGIRMYGNNQTTINNIVSVDSTTSAIAIQNGGYHSLIAGNTLFSDGGTGTGINGLVDQNKWALVLANNYVEGFSGTGGVGVSLIGGSAGGGIVGANASYNNATHYTYTNYDSYLDITDETLSNSGLAKSGSDTFANRFTYFAPADEGNMQTGGWPESS